MFTTVVAMLIAVDPTPTPTPDFNVDSVTPGWVGFLVMFLLAVVVILLIMDMVRRVRRVRYRAEIQERLGAEREAQDGGSSANPPKAEG